MISSRFFESIYFLKSIFSGKMFLLFTKMENKRFSVMFMSLFITKLIQITKNPFRNVIYTLERLNIHYKDLFLIFFLNKSFCSINKTLA